MMMQYMNRGGNSGVRQYEIGDNYIKVGFSDGSIYEYTYASAGSTNIEHMKQLALRGQGLNGFINTTVKFKYSQR